MNTFTPASGLEGNIEDNIKDTGNNALVVPNEFFFYKKTHNLRKKMLLKYLHFKENRQRALNEIVDLNILLSNDADPAMYVVASSYLFYRLENYEKKHNTSPFSDDVELQEYFNYLFAIADPNFHELNNAYASRLFFAKTLQKDYFRGQPSTKQPSKAL